MIQTTRPAAARPKCPKISGGRIRWPGWVCWLGPPARSQMPTMTKPPPAVATGPALGQRTLADRDVAADGDGQRRRALRAGRLAPAPWLSPWRRDDRRPGRRPRGAGRDDRGRLARWRR